MEPEAAPEVKEVAEEEAPLEEVDEQVLRCLQWSGQVATLPGLDGVSFRINENNLLEIIVEDEKDESPQSPSPEVCPVP